MSNGFVKSPQISIEMKILVLGATGMLGCTLFRVLSNEPHFEVFGTVRSNECLRFFSKIQAPRIITGINAENTDSLLQAYQIARPQVVINCIGLIKQLADGNNPLRAIAINARLPHQLSELCKLTDSRLIHISTDCVFSGNKGDYSESDTPDAKDVYGRSKLLGEVDEPHTLTVRTSMIGHELVSNRSLLEWFLAQNNSVKGFNKAIFSGLPVLELSHVIKNLILNRQYLSGLYHVAGFPISKYELLQLIATTYNKAIDIIQDDSLVIDRSLNAARFNQATGYQPPKWPELIQRMHEFSLATL